VPEELAPVQPVGRLTLTANTTNFFAETEQIAFHTAHLVPGIESTDDPLLQGRNFSYLDTQLSRLGGPNFAQLPINRPLAPVNDNHRDGMHQTAVHEGVAPYLPNSLGDGEPRVATAPEGGYVQVPRAVAGRVVREAPVSFDDHFSQATLFWASLSEVERAHVVEAFTFELGKVYEQAVKERELGVLACVDARLCAAVAAGLGLPAPLPVTPPVDVEPSPALSQLVTVPGRVDGRMVGVVVTDGADLSGVAKLRAALEKQGAQLLVVAPHGGTVGRGRTSVVVDRTFLTVRSIEMDAVVVADGAAGVTDAQALRLVNEAYRHCKAVGAWGNGVALLEAAGVDLESSGVLVSEAASAASRKELVMALGLHRAWDRFPLSVPV
jgi:catalase